MESTHWPIVLIEGVLVFGGVLAFGWWQLRSVERDRRKAAEEREAAQRVPEDDAPSGNVADRPRD